MPPKSTLAQAQALGLATPQPTDQIHRGDDAITENARFTADALTEAAAAAAAVEKLPGELRAELDPDSLVRGRFTYPETTPSAWRQTTDDGHYLPLGYQHDGHLDSFAREVFRADLLNVEVTEPHPDYAKVMITDEGALLFGIRWDGTVDIPGLSGTPVAGAGRVYADAPFTPGSDLLPVRARTAVIAGWGSSSMEGIGPAFSAVAAPLGATHLEEGRGSEKAEHIAARLGSIPARLTPVGGTIPATGPVTVTATNMEVLPQLKAYSGTWAGVHGRLHSTTEALIFTRTTDGAAVPVTAPHEMIPDVGTAHRDAVTLLWMGKNDTGLPGIAAHVIDYTDRSHDWLAPLHKRCLVLGHFINTNITPTHPQHANVRAINAAHAARYGQAFVDVAAYLASPQVWTDTGITPTAADLEHQSAGVLPVSLANDPGHLNGAGYTAVAALIADRLRTLNWY